MIKTHKIFILGAGASAEAGIPTMQNFLNKTDEIIKKLSNQGIPQDDNLYDAFNDVKETKEFLRRWYDKSSIDLNNIEHLYGALEMASTFGSLGDWNKREIEIKIKNLVYVIIRTIEESMILGKDVYKPEYPKPYEEFLDLIINEQEKNLATDISIITFNYDLAFEISHMLKKKKYNSLREYDYCLDNKEKDFKIIKLLKLHGSLNWAQMERDKINYFDVNKFHKPSTILTKQTTLKENTYPIASCLENEEGFEEGFEGMKKIAIIPPSFSKNYQSRLMSSVWREASKQLSLAEIIYICGFSLSNADNFFRYLYSIGTIQNSDLKKIFVYNYNTDNKRKKETEDRYKELIGSGFKDDGFEYYNKKFSEMIEELNPREKNKEENYEIGNWE